jgi:general secretion pathway protein N
MPGVNPMSPAPAAMDDPQATTPGKGNPLWGTPVESLHATGARPIFSPSRPPPTPPTAVAPSPEPPKAGIFGSGEGYAGFLDTTTHGIVRLKTSKGKHRWILRSVTDREAVLEKNYRTVVVRLPTITGD